MSVLQRKGSSNQKDSIGQYLNPSNGLRGAMIKKGIQPKDHMKDNVREMRELQQKAKEMKEEAERPQKELYKLSQFKDVSSRVYENSNVKELERRSTFENKEFLAKGNSDRRRQELALEKKASRAELDAKIEEARYYADRPPSPRKASVPKADEISKLAPHSNADFVNRNKVQAISMPTQKKLNNKDDNNKHSDYGRVPEYLENRKARWAEEEQEEIKRRPDPSCPPGMCLMPESERINTLEVLKQSREEANNQLRKLPFVIETPTMRKKQDYLESKLREIESAITIFNKEKVYVALDR